MLKTKILTTYVNLASEFVRCCRDYSNLDMAVAWCGNPKNVIPFSYLRSITENVRVVVGTSFNQTHPDAISFLRDTATTLRIVRDNKPLFHPKLYLFSSGGKKALLFGSSNFTFSGFCINTEVNVLIEGGQEELEQIGLDKIADSIELWCTDEYSFIPNEDWLASYRKAFNANRRAENKARLKTPIQQEENVPSASWLITADWSTYRTKLYEGLKKSDRDLSGYFEVLDAAEQNLAIPWDISLFDTIEHRRIIGGIGKYGWLGHVGASGDFRRILANGTRKEKTTIVDAVNTAALMSPVKWKQLQQLLKTLVTLGPTIKVWGRLLCLVGPDTYCTVASESVRKNLAETLGVSRSAFLTPEGYVRLLRLIHSSPWFNSPQPEDDEEKRIWERRVALIDAMFY